MSDLIASIYDLDGHKSASQRREAALREELGMAQLAITHLQAVLVVALGQRDTPLVVLRSQREEIIERGKKRPAYMAAENENGDVTYSLPPAVPPLETAETVDEAVEKTLVPREPEPT